jgi:CheY-like chemotaxis protein
MTEPSILIVDDDVILLESIADLLLLSDFRVITANNGVEALEILNDELPDCIISDIMMPEMDGYGLLEALRSDDTWSTIPVILLTAYDRPMSKRAGRDVMPDAVLSKPFDVDHLIEVIRDQLS